mmetsp:Transcript_7545/g.18417  ORF Transcript_7545/g.18417 Transcript_7545/m.18417 type:complete len:81 (-) Transcript_7545:591-833(-)
MKTVDQENHPVSQQRNTHRPIHPQAAAEVLSRPFCSSHPPLLSSKCMYALSLGQSCADGKKSCHVVKKLGTRNQPGRPAA